MNTVQKKIRRKSFRKYDGFVPHICVQYHIYVHMYIVSTISIDLLKVSAYTANMRGKDLHARIECAII